MTNKTRIRMFALVAALSLFASACSGSASEVEAGGGAAATDSASDTDAPSDEGEGTDTGVETESEATEDPAAMEESETTEDPEAPDTDGHAVSGECIVGDWVIDQGEMQGYYNALAADAGALDMTFTIDGQTQMNFAADGTLTYIPDFSLQLDTAGISGEGEAGGELTGTYVLDDGVITSEITENGLSLEVSVSGITMTEDDLGEAFASIPIASAPYQCNEQGPAIEFQTGGATHLVQLKPA